MLIVIYDNRTIVFDVTLKDASGTPIEIDTVGDTDTVRMKIGRDRGTPAWDLYNGMGGSSSLTVRDQGTYPGQVRVKLHQNDVRANLEPGTYDFEVGIVDDSDGDVYKHAATGCLTLLRTQGGATS